MNFVFVKDGVNIEKLKPEILAGIELLICVFKKEGYRINIRWGIEGKHSVNSKHYIGQAVDIRSKNIPQMSKEIILDSGKEILGKDYDFILEANGTDNEHYHLEYDPK